MSRVDRSVVDPQPRVLRAPEHPEAGQASILVIGLVGIVVALVLGVVGVTSVQLARMQLLDAADAAALDASDAIAREQVYQQGLGQGVPVGDSTVVTTAQDHLARRVRPERISEWQVVAANSPDGRHAVVTLSGTARIPVVSPVLSSLGGGVRLTVQSTARSDLVP